MLHSIPALIQGTQVVWLGAQAPAISADAPVMVVWDDARHIAEPSPVQAKTGVDVSDLVGRLKWSGDALAEQRTQRDAW